MLSAIQIAKPDRKMTKPAASVRKATVPAVSGCDVAEADLADVADVEGERGSRRLGWVSRPNTTPALQHIKVANVNWWIRG